MGKVVAIIQARVGSSRLKGKALLDIAGRPMLRHVVRRVSLAKMVDNVVVATTTNREDDVIADLCYEWGIPWFNGSVNDVLDRYYQAAKHYQADVIVRITGDCPLIDPAVIDMAIRLQRQSGAAYLSNLDPPTFPDGLDVEVLPFFALGLAHQDAVSAIDREHVTSWLRANLYPQRKRNMEHMVDLSRYRWCVDEQADLDFVRAVYAELGRDDFGMQDVLSLLERRPELARINGHLTRNSAYLAQVEGERHE